MDKTVVEWGPSRFLRSTGLRPHPGLKKFLLWKNSETVEDIVGEIHQRIQFFVLKENCSRVQLIIVQVQFFLHWNERWRLQVFEFVMSQERRQIVSVHIVNIIFYRLLFQILVGSHDLLYRSVPLDSHISALLLSHASLQSSMIYVTLDRYWMGLKCNNCLLSFCMTSPSAELNLIAYSDFLDLFFLF